MNVPVFVDSAAWGVLEIDSTVLRGFSDDTTRFLVGVAALISLVIRRVEAQTAQSKAIAATAQEAEKREILLREMQHRVKNNFQMLLALTALHQQKLSKASARELATIFGDAIRAMSLAHDQLSATQEGQVVKLGSYLKALASGIEMSIESIGIEVKSDELDVSIEQAVPIGLIVNELATNSVKHAFDKAGGTIRIVLIAGSAPGLASLSVGDNGKGMGNAPQTGSGLRLVRALADQIRAKLEQESSKEGTVTRLIFPQRVS